MDTIYVVPGKKIWLSYKVEAQYSHKLFHEAMIDV
jgi:hypothetical protein